MKTGELIKELRVRKGLTQEELADRTELSVRTIQRIENGEVDPRSYTLQMIAKALEVSYDRFFNEDSDEIQKANNKNWIGLLHLSGLVPIIFPTYLIWNVKKGEIKGLTPHYKTVLSFQLVILGVLFGCLWIYWKTGILTPFIGTILANSLIVIFGTIQALSGKSGKPDLFFNPGGKQNKTK